MKNLKTNFRLARTATTLLAIICSALSWADNVSEEHAMQLAQSFVNHHKTTAASPRRAPGTTHEVTPAGLVCGLYVFNVANDGGFVIVSNDDRTTPILGFSDSGSLDAENIPDNMRAWLQGYADEIAWLQTQSTQGVHGIQLKMPRRIGMHSTQAIAPMLTSTWNQGTPYNNLTPYYKDNGGSYSYSPSYRNGYSHCATGCAATAMAQLMYYHKWPQNATAAIPGYTWENLGSSLSGLPATTFDWENMLKSYSNVNYNNTQATAVATLMQYCGWSLGMNYGKESGASTQDVATALKNYFDYKETTQYVSRDSYTGANWTDLIYYELANGRPVLYAGQSSGGGHGFVCDGYEYRGNTDYFHINWGWGSNSDGYFTLSDLNPYEQGIGGSSSNDGFNNNQEAIIGIQRSCDNGTMSDIKHKEIDLTLNEITLSDNIAIANTEVSVTFNITNNSEDDFEYVIYLGRLIEGTMSPCEADNFIIPAGETKDLELRYTPTEPGTYNFYIYWFTYDDEFKYGSKNAILTVTDGIIPINLTTSNITPSRATISWNSNEATSYNVRYRTAGRDAIVFSDGFENGLGNWKIYKEGEAPFNGWDTFHSDNIKSLNVAAHGGEYVAMAMSYNGEAFDSDNWLVTPQLTFGSELKFWVVTNGNWPDSYAVLLSNTGNAISDFTVTLKEMAAAPGAWTEVTIDLSDYQGQLGYIAIRHKSKDCYYLLIDDFGVYVDAIEPGEWVSQSTTEKTISLTSLAPETTYEYQVQAVYGEETSEWTEMATFTTLPYTLVELSDNATDNINTLDAYNGQEVSVTLADRTLYKDGAWNTICLPFNFTLQGSPLEGAIAKTLTDATMTGTHVSLNFGEAVDELEAGIPYIIKWDNTEGTEENIVNPVFPSVTIASTEGQTITMANGDVKFIGYYDAFNINETNTDIYYMTVDNTLKHTAKARTLLACRAYFRFTEAAAARSFVLDFGDMTTEISNTEITEITEKVGDWYTLDGVKHGEQPTHKGIYIKDGKKVVIR